MPTHFRCWLLAGMWTVVATAAAQNCALVCNSGVQASLDASGQILLTPQMFAPSAANSCPGTLTLSLYAENGAPAPNPLTCSYAGQQIAVVVHHAASGNSCESSITLNDFLSPVLNCPDKFILCNQDPDPTLIGAPAISDNCSPLSALDISHTDDFVDLPCNWTEAGQPVTARIDRSWQAMDAHGNLSTCLQEIWIRRAVLSDVEFPPSLDGFAADPLDCSQDGSDIYLTGLPTIGGQEVSNDEICDLGAVHSDQIANNCGPGSFTIFRTWTVFDFCGGGATQRIQVIKVLDQTPPVVTPPADITVGTPDANCNTFVQPPAATATDDCSTVTITPSWGSYAGAGPFLMPEGTHTVTYTATDACGNSSTATARVTVVDDAPPHVICASSLQVGLSSGGTAYVFPNTVNVGTWDNCDAMPDLSVSLNGVEFASSVAFTCADIGPPILVTMRAVDDAGQENFCEVEVSVRDFVKPALSCPAAASLTCGADFSNLQLTGLATATDNCGQPVVQHTDATNLNECGVGSVTRTWLATDAAGNTRSCTQQITLNVVNTIAVTFPPDFTLNACADSTALLPPVTGQPTISGAACSALSVTYTDAPFATPPPPACFSFLRTWKVIEWCTYDPNSGTTGYWEDTQLIVVRDQQAPVLSLPPDLTVTADPANCLAVVAMPPASVADCHGTPALSHDSPFATFPGANASGTYPPGLHQIVFTATDACGNPAQQTLRITVLDQTAPVALCHNNVSLLLGADGTAALSPALLDAGSWDVCTPAAGLSLDVLPATFTCAATGPQSALLTVTDAAGNVAACQAAVQVDAPPGVCGPGDTYSIYGNIRTEADIPLAGAPVDLTLNGATLVAQSDSSGAYGFADLPDGEAALRPHLNEGWDNGVSTFDLVLISKHILGIQPLESPYKMIAADANHSNSITTFDIVLLRKLLLGIDDTLAGNTSWRFVPADHVFAQPENPFAAAFPEVITLDSLGGNLLPADFIGMKIGDVNNSATASVAPQTAQRGLAIYRGLFRKWKADLKRSNSD